MVNIDEFGYSIIKEEQGPEDEYAEEYAVLRGETNIYKGVEVVLLENPFGSFSFGKIYLNADTPADLRGVKTLRHEYGHTIQLQKYGWFDYTVFVVAPSVTFATFSWLGDEFAQENYYSLPWEYEAEVYGMVPDREYNPNVLYWYLAYRLDIREAKNAKSK